MNTNDLEIATASASELARIKADGDTPIEDRPVPVKMPRSFSLDDDDKSQAIQRLLSVILLLFLVYAVVMSTYAVIAIGSTTCTCSTEDVESALNIIGKGPPTTSSPSVSPTWHPSMAPSLYPSINPSSSPSAAPTVEPTIEPTAEPSMEPTLEPTSSPSMEPTIEPTMEPTLEPTLHPTKAPTFFDGYFIGDFKLSLQSEDHGFWMLCNGTLLPVDGAYSILFDVIGYMFGGYNASNVTYFKLPDVSDSVVGVAGNTHPIGEQIGGEETSLNANNVPPHRHPTVIFGATGDGTSSYSDKSLCNYYNPQYHLRVCNGLANTYSTGYQWETGGYNGFSVMQPTAFVSNLFIYSGVSL